MSVVDPSGLNIFNESVTKNQWVKVAGSFCRDFFTDGEVGKYQNNYDKGRTTLNDSKL